ncbi:MAG: hypothetical protein MPK62_05590, partial [Alphaproteobacteria bacterium]|nr:hypothetical protein [Alphaproteobacteria bacterium]
DVYKRQVYSFPPRLIVPAGTTSAAATVTIDPSRAIGTDRFFLTAMPEFEDAFLEAPDRTKVARVEFVVNAPDPAAGDDIAFFPADLSVEQGGESVFSIINLPGGDEPARNYLDSTVNLPTGVNLYLTGAADTARSVYRAAGSTFRVPSPADGASVPVYVAAGETATQSTVTLTDTDTSANPVLEDGTDDFIAISPFQLSITEQLPVITLAATDLEQTPIEGDDPVVNLTLTTTEQFTTAQTIAVAYGTDGNSRTVDADANDYDATAVFEFPANETTYTLAIPIQDDNIIEGEEVFTATIGAPDGARFNVEGDLTSVIIISDDDAGEGVYTIGLVDAVDSSGDFDDVEVTRPTFGQSVRIRIDIFKVVPAEDPEDPDVTVPLTLGRTILVEPRTFSTEWDPIVEPGRFTIPPGTSIGLSAPFSIEPATAGVVVVEEPSFEPSIGGFSSRSLEGPGGRRISNDITLPGAPVPMLSISPTAQNVTEGENANFTVNLNGLAAQELTGTVTVSDAGQTADADDDYTPPDTAGRTWTIARNASASNQISVATLDDAVAEGPETFTVRLDEYSDTTVASRDTSQDTATVTIIDNDTSSYNFIVAEDDTTPRSWPYYFPFVSGDPLAFTVAVGLSVAAGASETLTLQTNTDGILSAEQAPSAHIAIGTTSLNFASGDSVKTSEITITPPDRTATEQVYKFNLVIAPNENFEPGPTGTVQVVYRVPPTGETRDDFAFYPDTLRVRQGGTGIFNLVADASATDNPDGLEAPSDENLPTGINLHFNTVRPKQLPDVIGGDGVRFRAPFTAGETRRHLVQVAEGTTPGTYVIADKDTLVVGGNTVTVFNSLTIEVLEAEGSLSVPAAETVEEGEQVGVRVTLSTPAVEDVRGVYRFEPVSYTHL